MSRNLNIWDVFWTNRAQMGQNAKGRRVAGAIRSLVNARDFQLVNVLMYGSETMFWREKERSRIRAVQMDNLNCQVLGEWIGPRNRE